MTIRLYIINGTSTERIALQTKLIKTALLIETGCWFDSVEIIDSNKKTFEKAKKRFAKDAALTWGRSIGYVLDIDKINDTPIFDEWGDVNDELLKELVL